jgi:hypothetical protein
MPQYYIEVGKRKTGIVLGSAVRCYEIIGKLEHKLGRRIEATAPKLVDDSFWESENPERADRACKILDLIM